MTPFKLHPIQPAKANGERVKEQGLSLIIDHAVSEGETIGEAATEMKAPDHPVGNTTPKDISSQRDEYDHPQRPVYEEPNPFPPIQQVRKPFKL